MFQLMHIDQCGYIAGPLGLYGATVLYTHAGYTHCYIHICITDDAKAELYVTKCSTISLYLTKLYVI